MYTFWHLKTWRRSYFPNKRSQPGNPRKYYLTMKQHDSFLSSFQISTIIVTMAERNVFLLNNRISCNRQQALLFENPSQQLPCAIHLLALIGLSETALGGSCTRVSLRGEALLSLVCDWQNGIRCFEQTGGAACRLYSLYTCPYTCTHAHMYTHTHVHTGGPGKQTPSCCQQCVHNTVMLVYTPVSPVSCLTFSGLTGLHPNYRQASAHGNSPNSFHNSSIPYDAKRYDIMFHCRG